MASSISLWKRLRFRIEALGVRALVRILPVLPRKGLLHLARGLSFLAYRIDRRGRGIANENLRIVFPDKDAATRTQLVKGSYFHQTKSALDLMWAPRNLSASSSANLVKYTFEDRQDFETIGDDADDLAR